MKATPQQSMNQVSVNEDSTMSPRRVSTSSSGDPSLPIKMNITKDGFCKRRRQITDDVSFMAENCCRKRLLLETNVEQRRKSATVNSTTSEMLLPLKRVRAVSQGVVSPGSSPKLHRRVSEGVCDAENHLRGLKSGALADGQRCITWPNEQDETDCESGSATPLFGPENVACVSPSPSSPRPSLSSILEGYPLLLNLDVKHHRNALQRESKLFPFRALLARLMSHVLNRKGVFNTPVDHVALGLSDYPTIVPHPMDLGTVKSRLQSIAYADPNALAADVRLTFANAMRYNPPNHQIHVSAKGLLDVFEQGFSALMLPKEERRKFHHPLSCPTLTTQTVSSAVETHHSCRSCLGDTCVLCHDGCLQLEPTMIICSGHSCTQKIRKGSMYYIAPDGALFYCSKCYSSLPAIISSDESREELRGETMENVTVRYKRDLLKRRHDDEAVEGWVKCKCCLNRMHQICAMFNPMKVSSDKFVCPNCLEVEYSGSSVPVGVLSDNDDTVEDTRFSFVSGQLQPTKIDNSRRIGGATAELIRVEGAEDLPQCAIGAFIQSKVRNRMKEEDCMSGAEQTVTVRLISNVKREFLIPRVVRRHFQVVDEGAESPRLVPPRVTYTSRTIMLFQRVDGHDVCVFCMFVQEYDGAHNENVEIRNNLARDNKESSFGRKRVYVSYLDSVEHFRPRRCRSSVYQEVLVAYLASARQRGFEDAHIWACPPARGNSFIFWCHPPQQRTPTPDRLLKWYHATLARAVETGVVTDVRSLYDIAFSSVSKSDGKSPATCPPVLEGDFWIEQAVKAHKACVTRHLKNSASKGALKGFVALSLDEIYTKIRCPAMQVAALIEHKLIAHPSSIPFRRPVNAVALQLHDYHEVIRKPMDLATVQGLCLMGEYKTLSDLLEDVDLIFSNARKYNPVGNVVHSLAVEVSEMFYKEMWELCRRWKQCITSDVFTCGEKLNVSPSSSGAEVCESSFREKVIGFGDMSMRLSTKLGLGLSDSVAAVVESQSSTDSFEGRPKEAQSLPLTHPPPLPLPTNLPSIHVIDGICEKEALSVSKERNSIARLSFLTGGADAIAQQMSGDGEDETSEKKKKKKKNGKSRKKAKSPLPVPPAACPVSCAFKSAKRESWLGEEVGGVVKKMRKDFFVCNLAPVAEGERSELEREMTERFGRYSAELEETPCCPENDDAKFPESSVADVRHALLEFLQYRNYQFDTLRRAKYSSSMLLFHLLHPQAASLFPVCTSCSKEIKDIRWHRNKGEKSCELCESCYKTVMDPDCFVPLRVPLFGSSEAK